MTLEKKKGEKNAGEYFVIAQNSKSPPFWISKYFCLKWEPAGNIVLMFYKSHAACQYPVNTAQDAQSPIQICTHSRMLWWSDSDFGECAVIFANRLNVCLLWKSKWEEFHSMTPSSRKSIPPGCSSYFICLPPTTFQVSKCLHRKGYATSITPPKWKCEKHRFDVTGISLLLRCSVLLGTGNSESALSQLSMKLKLNGSFSSLNMQNLGVWAWFSLLCQESVMMTQIKP